MAVYDYEALDGGGARTRGRLDAESDEAARNLLKSRGLFPTSLKRRTPDENTSWSSLRRPGLRDLALFTRQLATLLEAGLTMTESLETVQGQTENVFFAAVIGDVRDRVTRGESLSRALREHGDCFSRMFTSMVLAGEKSGELPSVLLRVADYLDKRYRLRNKVLVSLAYPLLMSVVGTGILVFLVTFIAPTLTEVFAENGRNLPLITRMLMSFSTFLTRWWAVLLSGMVLAALAFARWSTGTAGKRRLDELSLELPLAGRVSEAVAMSRFSRTLGILLSSGVDILEALEITSNVLDNVILSESLDRARESLSQGADLASSLSGTGRFPRMLTDMIAAGQKSGKMAPLLIKVADDLDDEVETGLGLLTSLIEPVMILIMGLAVGFVVLAVVTPIFQMSGMY